MKDRDPDAALRAVSTGVEDWSGGTRISSALQTFNRDWSRRVLGQGAVVLLITDGLDRDEDGDLGFEIDRLHRSCARLIWLNRFCALTGSSREAAVCRPCCRMWMPFCRCIHWRPSGSCHPCFSGTWRRDGARKHRQLASQAS